MGIRRSADALKRAVFFDRDGVLNEAIVRNGRPHPPDSTADLRIDPAAFPAIRRLRELGLAVFVVTNQPDVARGTTTRDAVEAINDRIRAELEVDAIYTCFHDRADACECRKPRPGMLTLAAQQHGIDLASSYLVGDRWSDIAAGRSVLCRTVWIARGYDEPPAEQPDASVSSLDAACAWILDDLASAAPARV